MSIHEGATDLASIVRRSRAASKDLPLDIVLHVLGEGALALSTALGLAGCDNWGAAPYSGCSISGVCLGSGRSLPLLVKRSRSSGAGSPNGLWLYVLVGGCQGQSNFLQRDAEDGEGCRNDNAAHSHSYIRVRTSALQILPDVPHEGLS